MKSKTVTVFFAVNLGDGRVVVIPKKCTPEHGELKVSMPDEFRELTPNPASWVEGSPLVCEIDQSTNRAYINLDPDKEYFDFDKIKEKLWQKYQIK